MKWRRQFEASIEDMPKFIIVLKKSGLGSIRVQKIKDFYVLRLRGTNRYSVNVDLKDGYTLYFNNVLYDLKRKCFSRRSSTTDVEVYACLCDNICEGLQTALSMINDNWYGSFKMLAASLKSYCSLFSSNIRVTELRVKMETHRIVISKLSKSNCKIIGTKCTPSIE